MATTGATFNSQLGDNATMLCQWVLTGTNDGSPLDIDWIQWADKSVQVGVTGDTFNAGTVVIEGSNNGIDWFTLHDSGGTNTLSFTAAGLKQMLEVTAYVRPRASVSVTQVTVIMCMRRPQQLRV